MSDPWRRKTYYKPRVLIDTGRVLSPQYEDSLLCITGAQLEMLRNLTQYLHRRSSFVSSYEEGYYLAPTNEEWDSIEEITAELEETLMGCEEITAQLKCICDALQLLRTADSLPVDSALPDQPNYDNYRSDVEEEEGDPPAPWGTWPAWKIQKCKGAQKIFDDVVSFMAQLVVWSGAGTVLTFTVLEAALAASTVVPPLAIVLTIAALLAIIGLSAIQSAAQSWINEHKEGLVCCIYNASNAGEARAALDAYVAGEWDIAGSPQVFMHLMSYNTLSHVFDGTMPGYADWEGGYSADYCLACEEPEVGTDWWAWSLPPEDNTVEITNTGNAHWENGCWDGEVPAGQICCGVVFVVQNKTGDCVLKCMSGPDAGCSGTSLWVNQSFDMPEGTYLALNNTYVDQVEIEATLCPGATIHPATEAMARIEGFVDINGGFHLGWSCTGSVEIVFAWQIFEGTSPP